jgi:hypothetical protein
MSHAIDYSWFPPRAVQHMASIAEKGDTIRRISETNLLDGGGVIIIGYLKPVKNFQRIS